MSHFIISSKLDVHLRHAERAGEHAVVAGDAARLAGRLHDAVAGPLDGVGRADLGAGRRVAVHADDRARSASSAPRSTYSRWIIECPLCVSHSVQAWTHAWQPMQRFGSMKNVRWCSRDHRPARVPRLAAYCWGSTLPRPAYSRRRRRPCGSAHGADLVLGDLRDRVLRRDRQLVDALRPGPVVGDEDRVGPDRRHDLRPQRAGARAATRPSPSRRRRCRAARRAAGASRSAARGTGRRAGRCGGSACRRGTG